MKTGFWTKTICAALLCACAPAGLIGEGLIASASAQSECTREWLPGPAVPGVNGFAYSAVIVPANAPGGTSEQLYLAGSFWIAGDVLATGIARWDGSQWHSLGDGLHNGIYDGYAISVAALPDGVVAGGRFTRAGDVNANSVARWDGSTWHALGHGVNDAVDVVLPLSDGRIVIGGRFTKTGVNSADHLAIWDGVKWTPLGGGVFMANGSDPGISDLRELPDGRIAVCGRFDRGGTTTPISKVAIVDPGTGSWTALGALTALDVASALSVLPGGDLLVAGTSKTESGESRASVWRCDPDVGTWRAFGDASTLPFGSTVLTMEIDAAGRVCIAGTELWDRQNSVWGVFASDGGAWHPVGANVFGSVMWVLPTPNGRLFAGGEANAGIGQLVGGRWVSMNAAQTFSIRDLVQTNGGRVYATGSRGGSDDAEWLSGVYERRGSEWTLVTQDTAGFSSRLRVLENGDLLLLGSMTNIGAVDVDRIARYDGSAWHAVGGGLPPGYINDVVRRSDGTMFAAVYRGAENDFFRPNFFRLDGTTWMPIGGVGVRGVYPTNPALLNCMVVMPNDEILVGGTFAFAGDVPACGVARWDGSGWHAVGTGIRPDAEVRSLVRTSDGLLYAAGRFSGFGGPQTSGFYWLNPNSNTWEPAPGQNANVKSVLQVDELVEYSSDELLVLGGFASVNDQPASSIALWNRLSGEFTPLGNGLRWGLGGAIVRPNGDIWAGGSFTRAGDHVSNGFAIWGCRCLADADADGLITFEDFDALVAAFERGDASADLDGNGFVDIEDFDAFIGVFEHGCP